MPFVVLITGSSRGIGRDIAIECAKRGATVAMNYRSNDEAAQEALQLVTKACEMEGKERDQQQPPLLVKADVSVPEECERLLKTVVDQFGTIHALVNNAGINPDHDIGDLETVDFKTFSQTVSKTMKSNYESAANMSFLAIRQFLKNEATNCCCVVNNSSLPEEFKTRGKLVHISSRAAARGELYCPAYASSKAAMNLFGQSVARRFAKDKITSVIVSPGWIATEMAKEALTGAGKDAVLAQHPLGRVGTTNEISKTVGFCLFDAPPNMTGTVIDVNGASYLSY